MKVKIVEGIRRDAFRFEEAINREIEMLKKKGYEVIDVKYSTSIIVDTLLHSAMIIYQLDNTKLM